jgi:hypothetical protein
MRSRQTSSNELNAVVKVGLALFVYAFVVSGMQYAEALRFLQFATIMSTVELDLLFCRVQEQRVSQGT